MFHLLIVASFRLYMNPSKVVIHYLIWDVYTGDVGDEVGTRSRVREVGGGYIG